MFIHAYYKQTLISALDIDHYYIGLL